MDTTRPVQSDISDVLGRVRRHWWIVAALGAAGMAGGAAFSSHQPKVYEASTSILVQPVSAGQDNNVVGGRTKGDLNLDTEAQLVQSTAVAKEAAALMRVPTAPDRLAANVSVDVPANTSVLVVTYASGTPRQAQAGSHAFAQAYLQNRQDSATADLANQLATVNAKLQQLGTQLAQINAQLATVSQQSPTRATLDSQRTTVTNQINTLTGRANQLSTTTVTAGRIIRDADLPTRPAKPDVRLNLASGAMAGLLLGVGLGLVRERLDRRVRRAGDLPRRTGVAALASVPRHVPPTFDDVYPPFGPGGRIFNRLRNEVLASLPATAASHVIVVTGASRGPVASLVAANLAAAFARTGSETVLVSAHLPDTTADGVPAARLFGVRPVPGLSDVLAGSVDLADAAQPAPRTPWLRVVTTGGTASAGGLLQSQALRDMVAELRTEARYVVVEAPSTATSADAQSLASHADAAIVAVELRRTAYAQVADAAAQLARVGTTVLGAVTLPRLPTRGIPATPAPARPVPPDVRAVINRPTGPRPSPAPSPAFAPPAPPVPVNGNGHRPPSFDEAPTMMFQRIELPEDVPGQLELDLPAPPRDVTATGMLAAYTEDGPLDGVR